jgi:predicted lipoprotein with Yx(FWY)xxD motif
MDPGSSMYSPKQGWKRAAFTPNAAVLTPGGIELTNLPVANGYGFVNVNTKMPMYVLKTPPKDVTEWTPVYAPGIAAPTGDFTIIIREDGKRQWAYKKQPLYTFNADYSPSDLNGSLVERGAQPALAYRHFQPREISVQVLPARGPIMSTAKGLSVYTQARFQLQYGGRESRDGYRTSYADAKVVGTKSCVGACLQNWQPVTAPATAQSSGFWEVETRPDGTKQWAYKGNALYTNVKDKKAGDIQGNNVHDIVYGDAEGKVDMSLTGGDTLGRNAAGSGFYWHTVTFFN